MSLLGKILALLNLLGAVGLIYMASIDYARRQAWAYRTYRHDLILRGLPVDEQEKDEDNVPLMERISEDDRNDLFKGVGNKPVATQVDEVRNVEQLINGKLAAVAQNKREQTYHLARVLLPLADSYLEREQLQACRAHLSTDAAAQALKANCQKALKDALRPGLPGLPERPFSEAFRAAFREQGGEPAEVFLSLLLRNIPDDRAKAAATNFDQAYDAAVETQRVALENRYKALFAEAMGQSPDASQAGKKPGLETQKAAIARLLFGLCPFLAEDALFSDASKQAERKPLEGAPTQAAYQEALVTTPTYLQQANRMLVVCGLRGGLGAISERASVLKRLTEYANTALAQERQQFTYDHAVILDQIREQASIARAEQGMINENKDLLTKHTTVVDERKKEIQTLKEDLKTSREKTGEEVKTLRGMSQQVLDLRVKIRDAIIANEKGEERIRALEKQVRELDRRERD